MAYGTGVGRTQLRNTAVKVNGRLPFIYNERPAEIRAAIYPGYGVFADKYPIDLDEEMSRSKLGVCLRNNVLNDNRLG